MRARRPGLLLFAALLALGALTPGLRAAEDAKPVVLLTGFEPFGGLEKNASWESVKTFDGKEIGGYKIVTALLPVVYDEMAAPLAKAIETHKPAIVLSFGVGSQVVQVETLARNGYHPYKPQDNKGNRPPRLKIDPEGANEIPVQLPVDAIVTALQAQRIGAWTSKDAGGYLCNECFYRLMAAAPKAPIAMRGFVHVPDFGSQDPAGGTYTAEKLQKAVQIVVEETVKAAKAQAATSARK
ncbi:MAG: pyroglutamyl-peptidase I [Planctomycetota bacterium]|nr:pyroglutamyl-peptidase I [Planctomycetota bacterium]